MFPVGVSWCQVFLLWFRKSNLAKKCKQVHLKGIATRILSFFFKLLNCIGYMTRNFMKLRTKPFVLKLGYYPSKSCDNIIEFQLQMGTFHSFNSSNVVQTVKHLWRASLCLEIAPLLSPRKRNKCRLGPAIMLFHRKSFHFVLGLSLLFVATIHIDLKWMCVFLVLL